MNWKQATRAQLCEIAYNDIGAHISYRVAAAAELKRRNKQKHSRTNFREKAVYPR